MDLEGAGLIAGAIVLVGGGWLYLTEVRPMHLREECASTLITSGRGTVASVNAAISLCVSSGGIEKMGGAQEAALRIDATNGDPAAQHLLASKYLLGVDREIDPALAAVWFKKAAQQGNADAQYALGVLYLNGGRGVPKNLSAARGWFVLAAKQGSAGALQRLGEIYDQGQGVERDPVRAKRYFDMSAALRRVRQKQTTNAVPEVRVVIPPPMAARKPQ